MPTPARRGTDNPYVDQVCYQASLFELEKGVVLRDVVKEILRNQPSSISQVVQALRERGVKLHRLAAAGYLKALADEGVLEEREIPPAKVYALKPQQRRDLYRAVAERCREQAGADAPWLYLQVLTELLRRPVFREEFLRGGVDPPSDAREVGGEERQAARRFLSKAPLKLPFNDPAYEPGDPSKHRDAARAVLASLVRDDYHATSLAVITKQATLGSA